MKLQIAVFILVPSVLINLFAMNARAASHDDSRLDNVVPFQISVTTVPFRSAGMNELEMFELKLQTQHLSYVPIGLPEVSDYYRKGVVLLAADGTVVGYVVTGGVGLGSFWKLGFDSEMTVHQRFRLLQLITPYVQQILQALESEWAMWKKAHPHGKQRGPQVVVDFLNSDGLARGWALEQFGRFAGATMEDSSKGIEISFERIRSLLPPGKKTSNSQINSTVITSFQFGRVYSPNLRRYLRTYDGGIEVIDSKNNKVIGTIALPEPGTPTLRYEAAQVVLEYPHKRYHYGVGGYTLLYATDVWQAPPRGISIQRSCRDLFVY